MNCQFCNLECTRVNDFKYICSNHNNKVEYSRNNELTLINVYFQSKNYDIILRPNDELKFIISPLNSKRPKIKQAFFSGTSIPNISPETIDEYLEDKLLCSFCKMPLQKNNKYGLITLLGANLESNSYDCLQHKNKVSFHLNKDLKIDFLEINFKNNNIDTFMLLAQMRSITRIYSPGKIIINGRSYIDYNFIPDVTPDNVELVFNQLANNLHLI